MSKILNLSDLAQELVSNRQERCSIYWQIGTRINDVYGHPHAGIPFADMRAICNQLGVTNSYVTTFRRFAWEVKDADRAGQIIAKYGSWNQITSRFLLGLEPGVTERPKPTPVPNRVAERVARELGITKAQAAEEFRRVMRDNADAIAEVVIASVRFRSGTPSHVPPVVLRSVRSAGVAS